MSNILLPMTPQELEALLRRVVREEIHRVLRRPVSILDDPNHEGPEDSDGDEIFLHEALSVLQKAVQQPEDWMDWQEFMAEMDQARDSSEISD